MSELTTEQMLVEAQCAGQKLFLLKALPEINADNVTLFAQRLEELSTRAQAAWGKKMYLEYLSLLLMYVDVLLRLYLVGKNDYSGLEPMQGTLGKLIERCKKQGMDNELATKLGSFSDRRNTYVHRFVLYAGKYEDIEADKPFMSQLADDVLDYVIKTVGTEVVNPQEIGKIGQICIPR